MDLIGPKFHIKQVGGRTAIQTYDSGNYKVLLRDLTSEKTTVPYINPERRQNAWIFDRRITEYQTLT